MSLRKCEKLNAPSRLKRVVATGTIAGESAAKLFAMVLKLSPCADNLHSGLRTLLATSLSVLRECADETLRALCLFARFCLSLGCAGINRRDRAGGVFGRDLARLVCAADRTRGNADILGSFASAGICRAHDISHVCGPRAVAAVHADVCDLGGQERARRQAAGAHPGHSAVGTDPGFHFHYSRVLHVARPG